MALTVLFFCINLFFLTLVTCPAVVFVHWKILILLLSQFPLNFLSSKGDAPFHYIASDNPCVD